uniref:(northern house mosquito) hypothetical protein n=1 Tax=Culex pipiens TaxID=7175 RepID=A0A8D8H567_CULPI
MMNLLLDVQLQRHVLLHDDRLLNINRVRLVHVHRVRLRHLDHLHVVMMMVVMFLGVLAVLLIFEVVLPLLLGVFLPAGFLRVGRNGMMPPGFLVVRTPLVTGRLFLFLVPLVDGVGRHPQLFSGSSRSRAVVVIRSDHSTLESCPTPISRRWRSVALNSRHVSAHFRQRLPKISFRH